MANSNFFAALHAVRGDAGAIIVEHLQRPANALVADEAELLLLGEAHFVRSFAPSCGADIWFLPFDFLSRIAVSCVALNALPKLLETLS